MPLILTPSSKSGPPLSHHNDAVSKLAVLADPKHDKSWDKVGERVYSYLGRSLNLGGGTPPSRGRL